MSWTPHIVTWTKNKKVGRICIIVAKKQTRLNALLIAKSRAQEKLQLILAHLTDTEKAIKSLEKSHES